MGRHSSGPPDAVLSVKLGSQSPGSESVVELLLSQPGHKLPVSVEAEAQTHITDDTVDKQNLLTPSHQLTPSKSFPLLAFLTLFITFREPVGWRCRR